LTNGVPKEFHLTSSVFAINVARPAMNTPIALLKAVISFSFNASNVNMKWGIVVLKNARTLKNFPWMRKKKSAKKSAKATSFSKKEDLRI
jgi:hypothetical protein